MLKLSFAVLAGFSAPLSSVQAAPQHAPSFVRELDRNGALSAGWIHALPDLASACNLRLDNGQLTNRLVALSRESGNASYTADLYSALYRMENHHAGNAFGKAWLTRYRGKPAEACHTAELLWGDSGRQFPGILRRDGDGRPAANPANNCR